MRRLALSKPLLLPLLLGIPLLLVRSLWLVQQNNVNTLAAQINAFEQQINALPATVAPEDKLALEKDRLTLEKDLANAQNAIYGTLVQALGGAFFVVTAYFTYRSVKATEANVRATEEKQVTERFSKAIELLGSEKLEVRLGGIYALERIAKDSEKDYWTIMEILTGFVRERSQLRCQKGEAAASLGAETKEEVEKQLAPPSTDIRAVLTILNRRTQSYKQGEKERLDLSGSDFSWMILARASFKEMNLRGANFQKANLSEANLSGANLRRANLSGAKLDGADLSGASLEIANLSKADLNGAKLSEAKLMLANLSEAFLLGADLSGAEVSSTNLSEADLRGANLGRTNLYGATLSGTKLNGANLREASDLTQKQISNAITSESTKLPAYLQAPKSLQMETPSQSEPSASQQS